MLSFGIIMVMVLEFWLNIGINMIDDDYLIDCVNSDCEDCPLFLINKVCGYETHIEN